MPKPKDIGIIFDVSLQNMDEEYKELLAFSVRANGFCCVNVTPDMVMRKMGRIVGGDFGFIKAGAIEKISLIWPTVSLYNRVGLCPIAITSTDINNEKRTVNQIIKFDTILQILYPYNETFRKQKDFLDLQNFKNCTAVDSKERYFDAHNLYNTTSKKCQGLARGSEKYQNKTTNDKYAEDFFKRSKLHPLERAINEKWFEETKENKKFAWSFGLGKGLLIVFVTITIYLLICFSIFLLVTWISRRSNRGGDARGRGMILTPHQSEVLSEETIPLYTTCSLMSHR